MRLKLYRRSFFKFSRDFKKNMSIFIIVLAILYLSYIVFERIYPNFVSKIESYANNVAISMINKSVSQTLGGEYPDFVKIEYNDNGYISSSQVDTMAVNIFKSELIKNLQNNINNLKDGYISISLGSLLKKELLSGVGPKIKIKVSPTGMVTADFFDEFVSTGINQVKHKVYLKVSVKMTFTSATMRKSYTVESTVPVVENIISGRVPEYYGGYMNHAVVNSE